MTERRRGSGGGRAQRRGRPHFAQHRADGTGERFPVPPSLAMPKRVFVICHYCGYGPEGEVPVGGCCPKCGGYSWERFALAEPLVPQHMK